MTHDTGMHAPTPGFRSALEAEILRAYRREEGAVAVRPWYAPRLGTIARVAATLLLGVALGSVPAQVQNVRQRDSLLTAAQEEEHLAALRLMVVREEYDDASKRVEVGVVSRSTLEAADAAVRAAELRLKRVQLNIEEIRATAQPPRDDLSAPLVNGRDFVKERLQLDAIEAQRAMSAAEADLQDATRRVKVGVESAMAIPDAELALGEARSKFELLAAKMSLRQRVLKSELRAPQVENEMRRLELQQSLQLAQRQAVVAQARLKRVQDQERAGLATRADLLRAELDVLEQEAEMRRIEAQLHALRAPGDGTDSTARG